MSSFRNTSTGDVIDVPGELDSMYEGRPEYELVAPDASSDEVEDTGPQFDPAYPLALGFAIALENLEDIKGEALDGALGDLGLPKTGSADEKRDRLAERLNKEVNGG